MLKKYAREYFSFTRKERTAVIVLSCIILIVLSLPYLIPAKQEKIDHAALKEFELQLARLTPVQDTGWHDKEFNNVPFKSNRSESTPGFIKPGEMFYFDPNTLSVTGWSKLGVPEKTVRTIQNYLSKGGKFKRAEDIGKIYGMKEEQVKKLLPFVKLEQTTPINYKPVIKHPNKNAGQFTISLPSSQYKPLTLDINSGDTSAFIALPGIGSKLASRIVSFRAKLGGFHSINQLSEVYGLPDSTFQKIKPLLTVAENDVALININTFSENELKQHPYLKQNLAGAIFQYRQQHGDFKNVEDIRKVDIVTPEVFEKVSPYLTVK